MLSLFHTHLPTNDLFPSFFEFLPILTSKYFFCENKFCFLFINFDLEKLIDCNNDPQIKKKIELFRCRNLCCDFEQILATSHCKCVFTTMLTTLRKAHLCCQRGARLEMRLAKIVPDGREWLRYLATSP